ncbi:MAG: hypothetical protein JOZ81_30035 [Chloroflexi bacterium]|nr:hypothetical protein [Chloroflexota bacterium]
MNRVLAVLALLAVSAALACSGCGTAGQGPNAPAHKPAAPNGPQVLLDQNSAPGWPNHPGATVWLDHAEYHLLARQPAQFVAIRAPLIEAPAEMQVSARFHKVGGPHGGGYGLIVDDRGTSRGDGLDQHGEYVVAEVGDNGDVGLWRRENMRWIDLLAWTPSSTVAADRAANQLDVRTMGTRVVFFVNGIQVADVDAGITGPNVGAFAGGDGNEVVLERFSVQSLPTAPQPRQARAQSQSPSGAPPAPSAPPAADPSGWQRIQQLVMGIATDVDGIYQSVAAGPNDPHSPVNDRSALTDDAQRLGAAQDKARQLEDELQKLQQFGPSSP